MTGKWEEAPIVKGPAAAVMPTGKWEKAPLVADLAWEQGGGVTGISKGFAGGVTRGIAGMVGAPIDISTSILNAVGFDTEEQVGGKNWLLRQAKKVIDVPDAPATGIGRVASRVGEEVGAAAVTAGPILRAGRGVAGAIKMAGTKTGQVGFSKAPSMKDITQTFLDPIRRTPGAATAGEVVATVGSGTGAGVAQEYFPESPYAETAGQIVGGAAPIALGYTATGLTIKGVKWLAGRFSTKAQQAAAKEAIEKLMGGSLTPESIERIESAARLTKKAPGFKPTVAEATGDPSLIATQIDLEKAAQGEFLKKAVTRKKQSLEAIEKFKNDVAPEGDVDPQYVIDVANKRIDIYGNAVEAQVGKNIQKQKDIVEGIPTVDKLTTGEKIREGINKARLAKSAEMSIRADELGITDADLTVPFNEWSDMLESKYAQVSRFEDKQSVPTVFKQVMAEKKTWETAVAAAEKAGDELPEEILTTFQDIKVLRERITDDLINSIGSANPDRKKIRFLTQLKKDTDVFVNSLDDVLGENYKQFRTEYFDEYIKPFESGVVFKVRSKAGTGFYKSFDEKVADMFFDNQSGAKQYYSNFSSDAEMMQSLESSVLDRLQNDVVSDGVINEKKLSTWMKRNRGSLNELPEIKAKIENIKNTQEALFARQEQLGARRMVIEDTALSKQLARFNRGDIPAEKVLNDAMENPLKMASLQSFVKRDPAALGALKRIIWERITKGTSAEIFEYVNSHKKILKMLFDEQHYKNINDVVEMRSMIEIVPTPKGKAYIPSPLEKIEKKIGMPIPQMGTRLYAFKTGRLSKSYLLSEIARNVIYKKGIIHAEAMFKEALYNPEIAKEMANAVRAQRFPEIKANRLRARLAALALPYIEDKEDSSLGEEQP